MDVVASLAREATTYADALIGNWPGTIGGRLRVRRYRSQLAALGPDANIGPGLHLKGPSRVRIGERFSCWRQCTIVACDDGTIEIGDRVSFNANVYLNACNGGRIVLGSDVLVGPNVVLRTSDHRSGDRSLPINQQGHEPGEILVADDVWIAANVTLVAGARVGRGAVVAAGAVVTGDVEPYTIVGGVPAREIGRRA